MSHLCACDWLRGQLCSASVSPEMLSKGVSSGARETKDGKRRVMRSVNSGGFVCLRCLRASGRDCPPRTGCALDAAVLDEGGRLWVLLSRAAKMSDLTLVALPDRQYFESFLHQRNGMLVERMRKLKEMSARSTNSEDPTS